VLGLLSRPSGTTIATIMNSTGWQQHIRVSSVIRIGGLVLLTMRGTVPADNAGDLTGESVVCFGLYVRLAAPLLVCGRVAKKAPVGAGAKSASCGLGGRSRNLPSGCRRLLSLPALAGGYRRADGWGQRIDGMCRMSGWAL
jgi:hypothetical protein